jgi:benzoylformate decarboxylase
MLVIVGGQDRRFLHTQPILWGPLEQMARSVCKKVYTLGSGYDAAANIRGALRSALTPPYAPVALICPPDLLEDDIESDPVAVHAPRLAGLDDHGAAQFERFLSSAKAPAIIAAEDVHWSDGAEPLARLAAAIDAPVYAAPYTGVLPISARSPFYAGYLPPSMKQIADRLQDRDALLFVGGRGLRTTLYSDVVLPQRKAWIGADSAVQSDSEFELASIADLARALNTLSDRLAPARNQPPARSRRGQLELPARKMGTLHPTRAVAALLGRFSDAIWFDESGLSTSDVRQWMSLEAGEYIINGSGGIGWGLAGSIGGSIARADRQVVAAIGDGSALYASEALWTGSHCATRVLLVVFANRRYSTLNEAAERLAGGALESFTIEPPVLDFSGLAKLYGWSYESAATEEELAAVLADRTRLAGNSVLELKLDATLKPVTASRHF